MTKKEKLIECLAMLTEDELILAMATGLNCKHCPMAHEKGERCYDKTVCCKNLTAWMEEDEHNGHGTC